MWPTGRSAPWPNGSGVDADLGGVISPAPTILVSGGNFTIQTFGGYAYESSAEVAVAGGGTIDIASSFEICNGLTVAAGGTLDIPTASGGPWRARSARDRWPG